MSTATKYYRMRKGKIILTSNLKYLTFLSGSDFPAIPTDSTTSIFFLWVANLRAAPWAKIRRQRFDDIQERRKDMRTGTINIPLLIFQMHITLLNQLLPVIVKKYLKILLSYLKLVWLAWPFTSALGILYLLFFTVLSIDFLFFFFFGWTNCTAK